MRPRKIWVAVVDGNLTQIEILHQLARERTITLHLIVDFIHVAEYVWKAGLALYPAQSDEQDAWVRTRLIEILRGHGSYVAAGMRRSATLRSLASTDRKPVDACADYLLHYAPISPTTPPCRTAFRSRPASSKARAGIWSTTA